MKILIPLLIGAAIMISPIRAFSDAGSPIPVPKISAIEAIQLATQYFKARMDEFKNTTDKAEEYIVKSVEWTNDFDEEWAWKVKFVHPINNDVSWTFKVANDKKVVEEEMTI